MPLEIIAQALTSAKRAYAPRLYVSWIFAQLHANFMSLGKGIAHSLRILFYHLKPYFLSRNARQSLKPAVTTNHISEVSHNYYSRPKYRPRLNLCIPHTETKRREPTTYVDKRKVSQLCKPHSPDLVHHWLLYCRGQVREAPMRKDLFLFLVHTKKTQNKIAEYRLTLS